MAGSSLAMTGKGKAIGHDGTDDPQEADAP